MNFKLHGCHKTAFISDMKVELPLYMCGYFTLSVSILECLQVMDGFWRKLSSSQGHIPQQKIWFFDVTGKEKCQS